MKLLKHPLGSLGQIDKVGDVYNNIKDALLTKGEVTQPVFEKLYARELLSDWYYNVIQDSRELLKGEVGDKKIIKTKENRKNKKVSLSLSRLIQIFTNKIKNKWK